MLIQGSVDFRSSKKYLGSEGVEKCFRSMRERKYWLQAYLYLGSVRCSVKLYEVDDELLGDEI